MYNGLPLPSFPCMHFDTSPCGREGINLLRMLLFDDMQRGVHAWYNHTISLYVALMRLNGVGGETRRGSSKSR